MEKKEARKIERGGKLRNGKWYQQTGMRLMFLSVTETDSDYHAYCGTSTIHAVKVVGCMRLQLETGGSLEVVEVLFVLELKVNFISVVALEDVGYAVIFEDG